ncbi:MAG TPA: methyl-accepting chemotaxis protein, partial [Xanthobacteraceae bacterium]|nr:methyl-accepting chemotaxis protein [Xanthobacteraceae bacterium]
EQATGIEQVNKALTQMDEVTQQNSALVEENAATAKTLETQSAAMNERVSFFRLEDGAAVARTGRPAVRPAAAPRPAGAAATAPTSAASSTSSAKRGGIVGRMQSALATALKQDPDWKEF